MERPPLLLFVLMFFMERRVMLSFSALVVELQGTRRGEREESKKDSGSGG